MLRKTRSFARAVILCAEPLERRCMLSIVAPAHIVMVIEEDRAANAIGDTTNMPYFNQLASTGLVYSNSHGLNTPSQDGEMNYLALYSGSTQGVIDDDFDGPFSGTNLAQLLNNNGKSFVGYAEAMPHNGDTTDHYAADPNDPAYDDLYVGAYNPMAQFSNVGTGKTNANVNMTFANFPTTAAGYAALPTVSFVIPDTRDNTHGSNDTTPYATDPSQYEPLRQAADTWLKNNLNGYLQWAKQNNSLLIVTEDEGDRAHGFTSLATNDITTIINGDPRLFLSGTDNTSITPYNILRTIEDMYGLSHLGNTASAADLDTNSAGQLAAPIPKATTTTSLAASANPAVFGQSLTFTATVSGTSPTGSVTFMDGSTTLGSSNLNASGAATFTDAALAVGSHAITASYSGDTNNLASESSTFNETVNKASTSLNVVSSSSTSNFGQSITFTATLAINAPGAGTPGGSVQFQIDGSNFGTPVALAGATAQSAAISSLSAGTHTIDAVYTGDANFSGSTSAAIKQTVNPALPSYITASSGATYNYNPSTGALTLTGGTLTFTADSTAAPLINLSANGTNSNAIFQSSEHLAGLTLTGGAAATVQSLGAARTHSNHNVLVIGTLGSSNDPTFSIDSSSKLNLQDNDLIVHTGSSDAGGQSAYASVAALAAEGRNPPAGGAGQPDGRWTGNGLTSSSAASADSAAGYEKIGLAVVVNDTLLSGAFSSWQVGSFNETLAPTDVIVKYDYLCDYTLQGAVTANDAGILQLEYDNGSSNNHNWATGSSLYDGLCDNAEAGLFQLQYGLGTGGSNGQQL